MDNAKQIGPMGDHEKKPREQRVMEHAEETENGGMPRREAGGANDPDANRGGEPPRPVMPPQEPGKQNRSHS